MVELEEGSGSSDLCCKNKTRSELRVHWWLWHSQAEDKAVVSLSRPCLEPAKSGSAVGTGHVAQALREREVPMPLTSKGSIERPGNILQMEKWVL